MTLGSCFEGTAGEKKSKVFMSAVWRETERQEGKQHTCTAVVCEMQKETMCQSFSSHRSKVLRHDVHQQVHAISSKAADVRPLVMALNAKRQARDEAAMDEVLHSDAVEDEPLLSEAEDDKKTHQNINSEIHWQEYDEVRPPYRRVSMCLKPWAEILAACKPVCNHTSFSGAACDGYQVDQGLGTVQASWETADAYSTEVPERQLKPGKRGRAAIMPSKT